MRYSEELIEEVRLKNDVVDVISGYVNLKKKGSSYFGLCPFHNEKSASFSVTPSKQMYYCFGCGAGGNVISFIMEYENYSFMEAIKYLAERAGVDLPEGEMSEESRKQDTLRAQILELNKIAAKYFYIMLRQPDGKTGYDYLVNRELSKETMQQFGLGYASKYSDDLYRYIKKLGYSDEIIRQSGLVNVDEKHGMSDKFWNRVIFPIMDVNHRVIGFGGRVMGDGKPKYLNSPETKVFDKSRNLYGLNHARTSRKKNMIVCEGYMDVIALHQAGFSQAVASLGTAFTSGHANLLKRYTEEVYLTYDNDQAGTMAALRAIPILKESGISAKVINMQPYKDPDEFIKNLGQEAFQERIDNAENAFFFEIRMLESNYDVKDPEGRTRFHEAIVAKLIHFTEEIERENYLDAVAAKYMINVESLRKSVARQAARNEGIREIVRPKSGIQSNKEKENGVVKAQKLLLTWLTDEPAVYQQVKKHIKPQDFTDTLFQSVAGILFSQLEEGKVNPAQIVSKFEEEEEHRTVAALFNTKLIEIESKTEREKALTDIVIKVKENSLSNGSREVPEGMDPLMKAIADKKAIEDLEKIRISL
ncbi:MAG: DNA primase [Lachnospiraceae bacterium]|nr:DNA primase [Lachnospiraceae bacterium]